MQVKSQASVNSWGPTFSALLLDKRLGYLGDPTLLQRLWETGLQGLSSLHVREHCVGMLALPVLPGVVCCALALVSHELCVAGWVPVTKCHVCTCHC